MFENRLSYTTSIHKEVRTWVADSIVQWQNEKPKFFKIEMIQDELLPSHVIEAAGGANRNRRKSSLLEIAGLSNDSNRRSERRVQPA